MNEIHQCIPAEFRDKSSSENPYFNLVSTLLGINFLGYNDFLTTVPLFECIVRYADYFKTSEQFLQTVTGWFFSDSGIKHRTKAIASHAVNHYLRLIEKYKNQSIFPPQAQMIAQQAMAIITDCEAGKISRDSLDFSEI